MMLRRATVAVLSAVAAVATLVVPAQALDVDPEAPVVVDDALTMWPGDYAEIDVLANDSDPGGDDLALCRVPSPVGPDDVPVTVIAAQSHSWPTTPGTLQVMTDGRARGTHVVDYYVCNHTRLTLAHLTVTIRPVQPVDVRPDDVPNRILVTNHNDRKIFFIATDARGCKLDVHATIAAGETRSFTVRRHRLRWMAGIGGGIADFGWVRDVRLTHRADPPGPKDRLCWYSFDRMARQLPGIGASGS